MCDLKLLFLEDINDNGMSFIADLGVYTRNRHMRLYRSSKLHREEHLVVAEENLYPVYSEEQIFTDSLIIHPAGASNQHLLTCAPMENNSQKKNTPAPDGCGKTKKIVSDHRFLDEFVLAEIQKDEHYKDSGFQEIVYSKSKWCVAYFMDGPKWCRNVNRVHSTNRPYFCANMKYGCLYQMCHSQKCRGYRSEQISIPHEIWGRYHMGDEEELVKQLLATDDIADGIKN